MFSDHREIQQLMNNEEGYLTIRMRKICDQFNSINPRCIRCGGHGYRFEGDEGLDGEDWLWCNVENQSELYNKFLKKPKKFNP